MNWEPTEGPLNSSSPSKTKKKIIDFCNDAKVVSDDVSNDISDDVSSDSSDDVSTDASTDVSTDGVITSDFLKVSIVCPLSKTRIKTPVR